MATTVDELSAWLALSSLATTGTQRWLDLVFVCGSARAALSASDAELGAVPKLSPHNRAALRAFDDWDEVARLRATCHARRIGIAAYADPDYPQALRTIEDPPLCLYWRGGVSPAAVTPAVAVVGARRATRYGLRTARRVGAALAEAGAWVVSGLAIGIDAAAQEAAVGAGRTAAVLAGGIDRCFPGSNRRLAAKILETGIVLSELRPGTPTLAHQFPIRNRIITGMAKATVIVEAHAKGGSLVSARWALAQSREVIVVPGPIDSPASAGTNRLLEEGATPLIDLAETLDHLGLARVFTRAGATRPENFCDPVSAAIFAELSDDPLAADEIVLKCRLDESVIMEKLTALELDGLAERLPGGTYVRSSRASEATERS